MVSGHLKEKLALAANKQLQFINNVMFLKIVISLRYQRLKLF